MSHYVTLMFDVEDLCWPASDDIALDLAEILTRNKVQGTFFVVGEKARLWRSRRRTDVIASLAPQDVALHRNLHSIHPTVSEYLAHWPIHDPNIDPERILLHTRLQCWTLRPALAQAEQRSEI